MQINVKVTFGGNCQWQFKCCFTVAQYQRVKGSDACSHSSAFANGCDLVYSISQLYNYKFHLIIIRFYSNYRYYQGMIWFMQKVHVRIWSMPCPLKQSDKCVGRTWAKDTGQVEEFLAVRFIYSRRFPTLICWRVRHSRAAGAIPQLYHHPPVDSLRRDNLAGGSVRSSNIFSDVINFKLKINFLTEKIITRDNNYCDAAYRKRTRGRNRRQ